MGKRSRSGSRGSAEKWRVVGTAIKTWRLTVRLILIVLVMSLPYYLWISVQAGFFQLIWR